MSIMKQMSLQLKIMQYLKEILESEAAAGSLESKVPGEELPFIWIFTEDWTNG